MTRRRIAVVTSHPIQYHAPWFRALANSADLTVYYCHRQDAAGQAAAGFGVAFDWDVPLLDGYHHEFLTNRSPNPNVFSFGGCDTPDIGQRLRSGGFHACIVTGWYLKSYLQTLAACRRQSLPIICRGDSQLATQRGTAWAAVKYMPYRLMLNQFSAHLYVGQANHDYLRHYGVPERRLFFAPHFIDNEFFARAAEAARQSGIRDQLRASFNMDADAQVLIWVGKFIDKKRPLDFVNAVQQLARETRVHGVMVGDGPLRPAVEAAAASSPGAITLVGFKNQSALPEVLAAADALVLTSDAGETWGLVVNEAMATGLPAVVSDAAGSSRDLIVDGETGFAFPCGDVESLRSRLRQLVDTLSKDRASLSTQVRQMISRYTCAAATEGTLKAVDAVASTTHANVA